MNQTTRLASGALEARVRRDLEFLNLPPRNWVPPRARQGEAVLDVVVVGAGMNGIAAAGALIHRGISNIAVLEAREPGREGPWMTTARMDTLRSPKTLPGPCLGIPSLTFRAWHEDRFGPEAWGALYKIPNAMWQDYLSWLQRVLELPVRHGVRVTDIAPEDGLLRLAVETPQGAQSLLARHVVLATGRAGAGGLVWPSFVPRELVPDLAIQACEPLDFAPLVGKSLAVIGAGASAWDNAATALERGAASATLYVRAKSLPQINKGRGSTGPHYFQGWDALTPEQRWELMGYMLDVRSPPPHETVHRALRLKGFSIVFGAPTLGARREGAQVVLSLGGETPRQVAHDYLVVATGYRVDLDHVPELARFAPHAQRFGDVVAEAATRPDLAAFPFLGPGFELLPRGADAPSELGRIHLMNHGAIASLGAISSDIPGVMVAGERVAHAILRALMRAEWSAIREALQAFDEPELESTPFYVPRDMEPK